MIYGQAVLDGWRAEYSAGHFSVTISVPVDGADGWIVEFDLERRADGVDLGDRILFQRVEAGAASAPALLRQLRMGDLYDAVERALAHPDIQFFLPDEWIDAIRLKRPRVGRAGRSAYEYALWARRYVEALEVDPKRPMAVLMAAHPGWKDHAIRSVLHKARADGLLTASPKGEAGGELTDKARRLLDGER